jgi:methylmalonyl-CoA/ethylmalonyl-CoA epimerase
MALNKIEHIGIAVRDLGSASALYEKLLGKACYKVESVEGEGVRTAFFGVGESKIELLEAMTADSPIARFIEKRGEGIHHIAFEVDDLEAEAERLRSEGFRVLSDSPRPGADKKRVLFLHPKSSHGVLIELCQQIADNSQ